MKRSTSLAAAAAIAVGLAAPLAAQQAMEQKKPMEAAQMESITATVVAIDAAKREVSLKGPKGNVVVVEGDGWRGLPQHAPFDRILVTAAPEQVPQSLVDQLRVGGRMVLPVGRGYQSLRVLEKTEKGIEQRDLFEVRFVPMVHGPRPGS